jgi:hypothetical protein
MALSDQEARQFAESFVADVVGDVEPDPISVYSALGPNDQIGVGRHLIPILTEALAAFNAGDRSANVLRLVGLCTQMEAQRELTERERAERKHAELWARALAFTGNKQLASRMTIDSGFMHIPVPADAEHPKDDLWVVGDVSAEDLVGFYVRFMAAAGWVLDLRDSTPEPTSAYGAVCTALCFGLPDPVRWVTIRVWDDPQVATHPAIQLQVADDDDTPTLDWRCDTVH